jgi:hypothetical protein
VDVEKYNAMVGRINLLPDQEVKELVDNDKCPFESELMIGVPIGQFHCLVCGEMVLPGSPHPKHKE